MHEQTIGVMIDQALSGTPSDVRLLLVQSYRDELVRREQQRSTDAMLAYTKEMHALTKQIRNLTIVILAATVVTVVATFWPR
jgi:hypothetical protein